MRSYAQYCPVAKATEILGDRWTLLIVREMLGGASGFNELQRGLPGISRSVLTDRMRTLERAEVIERRTGPRGRTLEYRLTPAGRDLQPVVQAIGEWGATWSFTDPRPEGLDPDLLIVWMARHVDHRRLPPARTVVQFNFRDPKRRYWMVLEPSEVSVCLQYPGFPVDLDVRVDTTTLYRVYLGQTELGGAIRAGQLEMSGAQTLQHGFGRWFTWSAFAPASRSRTNAEPPRRVWPSLAAYASPTTATPARRSRRRRSRRRLNGLPGHHDQATGGAGHVSAVPAPDARTRYSSERADGNEDQAWPEFDAEARALLESAGEVIRPGAGELLWEAGDAYDLYLVLAGGVGLVDRRDGRVSFVVEAGDFVAELGMLMGQPAFLAGVAMPGTTLLRVGIADLKRLMATSTELSDVLLAALDARRRLLTRLGEGGLVLAGDDDRDMHRLQQFAERNHVPYRSVLRSDPSAWSEVAATCALPERGSAVVTGRGRFLTQPTTRELAAAVGLDLSNLPDRARCDLLIVGAGPAGLAAAVYGASEGLDVMLVEDVALGGQAGTSSRIENYLGFPRGISGGELARSAMLQAVKFGARLVSPRSVTGLSRTPDGFRVRLDDHDDVAARAVVLAGGVHYRRLEIPGVAEFEGRGVYYAATELEARACVGQSVAVVGGANSAGQAALFLTQHVDRVHVLIRRDDLTETMSSYLAQRIAHHDRITVHPRSQLTSVRGAKRVSELTWRDEHRHEDVRLEAGGLFLMIGAVPRTAWLHDAGVELDPKGFVTTRETYATSVPGLFAVGDVRAGSVKRVASAVGEGSVVVSAVHAHLGGR